MNPASLVRLISPLLVLTGVLLISDPSPATAGPARLHSETATPDNEYVALGDSYSSGEGLELEATQYINPSNTDGCHRSKLAYPELVAASLGVQPNKFNKYDAGTQGFVACSGAASSDVVSGADKEPSQLDASSAATKYVTITVGGNDLGFVNILTDCLDLTGKVGPLTYTDSSAFSTTSQCEADLSNAESSMSGPGISSFESDLLSLYGQVQSDAPNAELLVLKLSAGVHFRASGKLLPRVGGSSLSGCDVVRVAVSGQRGSVRFDPDSTELNCR